MRKWLARKALYFVMNRIRDLVFTGDDWKGGFDCTGCGEQVYDIDDETWLECIVWYGFNHKCK